MARHMSEWKHAELLERNKAADEKIVAERKWQSGLKPRVAQEPCDVGMFSDDSKQADLFS
jgi:hypothetical protein